LGPQPTDHPGFLRIPAPSAAGLLIRYSPLADRDRFDPTTWPTHALTPSAQYVGWWEFDLDTLGLPDGSFEYEFLLTTAQSPNGQVVPDAYADTITRFGGYRGIFEIAGGKRLGAPFRWDPAIEAGATFPPNNEIVIYEMPLKWMSSTSENSLVELGTFDKVIFEHLDALTSLGINCIELLPIEDSSQTLDWGYGTRFFFAPDYDIGQPVDTKFFIKCCHQRGIRVILDVVMNFFDQQCPLAALAPTWFAQAPTAGRQDWGGVLFQFNSPAYSSYFAAREFLYQMAAHWVAEYHVDGFRIDDFADIDNWDFVQGFHDRATAASATLFPQKPFVVIAEDSNRRFSATDANALNAKSVVDAIWNFGYRDELRRLVTNAIVTTYGQASRTERVAHMLSKDGVWNGLSNGFDPGYADMACAVDYATSHDVSDAPRMMNLLLGPLLAELGVDSSWQTIRAAVDGPPWSNDVANAVQVALRRAFGVFAILLTSVGMPMFLAGEEFGDVHDSDYTNSEAKQQDPVQWGRAALPGNAALLANIGALIRLRTAHPALARNEVALFYAHPQFDATTGCRVFGYCRTGGLALGSPGQVIVVANAGPDPFPTYGIPAWPWAAAPLAEFGYAHDAPTYDPSGTLSLGLDPFEVRVFTA
jgi:glycosidase